MSKKYKELEQECIEIENRVNKRYEIINTTNETYTVIQQNKKNIKYHKDKIYNIEQELNIITSICFPFEIFLWSISDDKNNYIIAFIMLIGIVIGYGIMLRKKKIHQELIDILEEDNETRILLNNMPNKNSECIKEERL